LSPDVVRTVLGDLPADQLGVCDAHDHLFFTSQLLAGQELDDPDAATAELAAFGAVGGRAVVQWTPYGLGRRVRAGLIKVAGEFHALSEHARRVMTAAAEAHHATGAPIGVHLEHGTAGLEVIELIGGDTTTSAARGSTGGGPGIPYLLRRLRPRLVHELGAGATEEIFLANPARAFGVAWS
jgi:phosphotriesterase-related protein